MKGRRLLALTGLALAFGCVDNKTPTAPRLAAPSDPSAIISDGAHGGNPDFFFLPPMVPLPLHNPNFELGKFNNTLKPSLTIEICELKNQNMNAQGLPTNGTGCVGTDRFEPGSGGTPLKTFAPGSVKLVNLPIREFGWWNLFNLPPDGFYYVLWDTRQSNLDVNKYYRIKVFINGSRVPLGIADVDPMSSLRQWKYSLTGEVIQLIDDVLLPIPFRVEKSALCPGVSLCTSVTVTNDVKQIIRVQSADGSFIAGVLIPPGFLPPPPGPQSVVLTISRVNTGANNVGAGTQAIPCHTGLPLQQFNSCFNFSTIPELATIEGTPGHQFVFPINVAVCFILHDTEDSRAPWVQLWSSDEGGVNAKPLQSAVDLEILAGPSGHTCGNQLVGFNSQPGGFRGLASAGWGKLKGGLGRVFGVQTAYAVDVGLGGLAFDLSNIGPALTAEMRRSSPEAVTVQPGGLATPAVTVVGTKVHNGNLLGAVDVEGYTRGIPGLPVTFTVAPGSGTLTPSGSVNAEQVTQLTTYTGLPVESELGGGGASVDWHPPRVAGTYRLFAKAQARVGSPPTSIDTIGFTAVVPLIGLNALQGSWSNSDPQAIGITRLNIAVEGSAASVHAWASCGGGECDWNPADATNTSAWLTEQKVVAFWDQGFATRTQTITWLTPTTLKVVTFTHFVPPDTRTDYTLIETFTKDPPIP